MKKQSLVKKISTVLSTFLMISTATTTFAFNDINPGNKNYTAIEHLKSIGVIKGYEDGNFKPRNLVSRAEALKMFMLGTGQFTEEEIFETAQSLETNFSFADVAENHWYIPYLKVATEKGIISGYEDNTFKPSQTVNLAESLKIFFESFKEIEYPSEEFIQQKLSEQKIADISPESWYTPYAYHAASKEMLEIFNDFNINIDQQMTRGHVAELIYRYLKSTEGYQFGKATFYGSAVHGRFTASGERFDKNLFTAAHKTIPFGTKVRVTNMANNKSVDVKINDRGPYGAGRVIDLSSAAFSEIASLGAGVIHVQYQIIE